MASPAISWLPRKWHYAWVIVGVCFAVAVMAGRKPQLGSPSPAAPSHRPPGPIIRPRGLSLHEGPHEVVEADRGRSKPQTLAPHAQRRTSRSSSPARLHHASEEIRSPA
jgi:hypothetical protein